MRYRTHKDISAWAPGTTFFGSCIFWDTQLHTFQLKRDMTTSFDVACDLEDRFRRIRNFVHFFPQRNMFCISHSLNQLKTYRRRDDSGWISFVRTSSRMYYNTISLVWRIQQEVLVWHTKSQLLIAWIIRIAATCSSWHRTLCEWPCSIALLIHAKIL